MLGCSSFQTQDTGFSATDVTDLAVATHWVQRDRPEVVTPVVLDFLNELG